MTDNEIIKALECCNRNGSCSKCPYDRATFEHEPDCASAMTADALDLINRQNSNIEELKSKNSNLISDLSSLKVEVEKLTKVNATLLRNADTAYQEGLNEARALYACEVRNIIRAEAVKEFAERLKDRTQFYSRKHYENIIDNLVKEFTKGDEDED